MKKILLFCVSGFLLASTAAEKFNAGNAAAITAEALAPLLPEKPRGMAETIENRSYWETCKANISADRQTSFFNGIEKRYKQLKTNFSDEAWLEPSAYSVWSDSVKNSFGLLKDMTLAECLQNQGAYIPRIEAMIDTLTGLKTWVNQYHDREKKSIDGSTRFFDLRAGSYGCIMADAIYLLGNRLSPETRTRARASLMAFMVEPYRNAMKQDKPPYGFWWIQGKNNWNSVCHANLAGVVCAIVESPRERAEILAHAIKQIQLYVNDFGDDGYCTEGTSYWSYGFSHYMLFAEIILAATDGQVNLYAGSPKITAIGLMPQHLELSPGLYPAFSDSVAKLKKGGQPIAPFYLNWARQRLGVPLRKIPPPPLALERVPVWQRVFGNAAAGQAAAEAPAAWHYFNDAAVIVSRAAAADQSYFSMAVKGGNNAEQHNHNDLGSFVIALDGLPVITDPGLPYYTWDNFSAKRYQNRINNSYGHPVPLVDGKLQGTGKNFTAKILKADFSDEKSVVVVDLRQAYPAGCGLKKLERAFIHDRMARSITLTDTVEFDSPRSFAAALVTYQPVKSGHDTVKIGGLTVKFTTGSGKLKFTEEVIDEKMRTPAQPTRLGYELEGKVTKAIITLEFTPSR